MVAPCRDKWLWTSPLLSKTLKMSAYCSWHTLLALMGPSLPSLIHFWTAFWPRVLSIIMMLSNDTHWMQWWTPGSCTLSLVSAHHRSLETHPAGLFNQAQFVMKDVVHGAQERDPTQRPHGPWQQPCGSHEYQLDFRGDRGDDAQCLFRISDWDDADHQCFLRPQLFILHCEWPSSSRTCDSESLISDVFFHVVAFSRFSKFRNKIVRFCLEVWQRQTAC